jgi:hypothetical protein
MRVSTESGVVISGGISVVIFSLGGGFFGNAVAVRLIRRMVDEIDFRQVIDVVLGLRADCWEQVERGV